MGFYSLRSLPPPPTTLGDLQHQLEVAWNVIPQQEIDHFVRSMYRRVGECINNRGDVTFINFLPLFFVSLAETLIISFLRPTHNSHEGSTLSL